MTNLFLYITIGVFAGAISGLIGIGGGIIIVPCLIYIFGFSQHAAQGTTLAMLIPPIGLLAALRYYQSGNVKLSVAAFICAGFLVGGYLGAGLVQSLSEPVLRKVFGIFLLLVSLRMIFSK